MSAIESKIISESKFLGHRHTHEFTKETVESEITPNNEPNDEETSELDKIKESLMKAYEDYVTPKSSIIDKSLQKKVETTEDDDDFSFTVNDKVNKKPVKVECKNAIAFESKLLNAIKNPRFGGLVDYSYPTNALNEGITSQSIIPYALKLAPLLKPETREEAFAAIDHLRDAEMSADDIKQVWRLAKIFRNSKKPEVDPVDESTVPPITPVAPISSTNTTQTNQTQQPQTQQSNQQTNQQPQNQQQTQQQTQQQKPTATAKDSITTMLDTIKKNPSAIDTLKKGIENLPQ